MQARVLANQETCRGDSEWLGGQILAPLSLNTLSTRVSGTWWGVFFLPQYFSVLTPFLIPIFSGQGLHNWERWWILTVNHDHLGYRYLACRQNGSNNEASLCICLLVS